MTALIELPATAQSAEAWRRQIAEVCERDSGINRWDVAYNAYGGKPPVRQVLRGDLPRLCAIIRRHFTVTPANIEAVKAGIRLYCGMGENDVIQSRWLMDE